MTNIIRIDTIEPLDDNPGVLPLQQHPITYEVIAWIDDMVQTSPAILNPPDIAEPAQFGSAECRAEFTLEPGELRPPVNAPMMEIIQYLDGLDLDWQPTGFN